MQERTYFTTNEHGHLKDRIQQTRKINASTEKAIGEVRKELDTMVTHKQLEQLNDWADEERERTFKEVKGRQIKKLQLLMAEKQQLKQKYRNKDGSMKQTVVNRSSRILTTL